MGRFGLRIVVGALIGMALPSLALAGGKVYGGEPVPRGPAQAMPNDAMEAYAEAEFANGDPYATKCARNAQPSVATCSSGTGPGGATTRACQGSDANRAPPADSPAWRATSSESSVVSTTSRGSSRCT